MGYFRVYNPPILTIDPNFQRYIQVSNEEKSLVV